MSRQELYERVRGKWKSRIFDVLASSGCFDTWAVPPDPTTDSKVMNDVFFACRTCKDYIDAGYRWPVTTLFPDQRDQFPLKVNVQAVLSNAEYWGGETAHPYLAKVLPAARRFLHSHEAHDLVFGDFDAFMKFDDSKHAYLEWLEVTTIDDPELQTLCLEPRYFAEHPAINYRSWDQVEAYCRQNACGWNGDAATTSAAREVFLRAVRARTDGQAET
ncbi:hypothetical protein [Rhizobacter sp. P5_C2]